MRISICGPLAESAIAKAEGVLGVSAKLPWKESIIDYAAETYKYFNEQNVIFKGSVFDFLTPELEEGYDDEYEQIALDTLNNVDYIAVIAMDMNKQLLKVYKEYQELYPEKFHIYLSPTEFEVTLR
jgi:hypothetical protein